MLRLEHCKNYSSRWPIAEQEGFFSRPRLDPLTPLVIRNRHALKELSFAFFVAWLFTGSRNRAGEVRRATLLPVGPHGESSVLVIHCPNTRLAAPSWGSSDLLDPGYFFCPLDRSGGQPLPDLVRNLCPVVNRIRYNLGHARMNGDVAGFTEPPTTESCCHSAKQKFWEYLDSTLGQYPDLYGPMIGGMALPLALPFRFLHKYLAGLDPRNLDFGKLLEETLLWFAMAASDVVMGFVHVSPKFPIAFNEIDLLLYEARGDFTGLDKPPPGIQWEDYLCRHAVCLMEFTIGHYAETAKQTTRESGSDEVAQRESVLAKDVPKNKLMNYHAFCSYRFQPVHAHYFSITGESGLAPATRRTLVTTEGFRYVCISDLVGENIDQAVLNHQDTPIPIASVRTWHECVVAQVETAASTFKAKL